MDLALLADPNDAVEAGAEVQDVLRVEAEHYAREAEELERLETEARAEQESIESRYGLDYEGWDSRALW